MPDFARGGSRAVPRTAFDDACRALGRRRLTEAEVRQRLSRRHSEAEINRAVKKLKEYRFLDDEALIADHSRDRLNYSPRSAELIEAELGRRGIEPQSFRRVFDREFPDYDELEMARRALQMQSKKLMNSTPQGRRERALRFLRSRGFSYDVMMEVWEEFRRGMNSGHEETG